MSQPPKITSWIIQHFLSRYNHFPALGDLDEEFNFMCQKSTILKARHWYRIQVLKSIPFLINHILYWSLTMFASYVKIALRNLYKNKLYSFINIFGLGVAIAVCITGYINFQFSQSFDAHHENKENIHLVNTFRMVNNGRINLASSPTLLAPAIKNEIPGIVNFSRLARNSAVLRYEDKVFNESVYYLDENFFDMFTFPMLKGDKNALKDKNSMVITDEIALKYFGDEDPIGKQIIFTPAGEKEYSFIIRGVIEKPSTQSSLYLTVCLPYERQEDMLGYDLKAQNDWTSAAFIQTSDETAATAVESQMQNFVPRFKEANPNYPMAGFYLTALPKLYTTTRALSGHPFHSGFTPAQIIAPSVIALLVLLLACFNFVNTAIAYASGRLKEIGIRKVIGGMRGQLVLQFLGENLILCLIALGLGLFLAEPFVKFYDGLFPETHFALNYIDNSGVLIFLVILLIFTALAAGAYPAFYVSKFNPVTIFRGKQQLGGTNRLIRILLTFQFTIAISAILAGIIFYQNGKFIENFDLGFDKDQILVVPVRTAQNYELLKSKIQNNPDILSIGASQHMMGRSWNSRDIEFEQNQARINVLEIGENYFETLGLELAEGQKFQKDIKADAAESIIINETMAQTFGLVDPIGKYIKFRAPSPGKDYRVIGVVKDFHLSGLWIKIRPLALRIAPEQEIRYLSAKFNLNRLTNVSEYMRSTWKELFPHLPYDGFFQTEILEETIQITAAIKSLFIYIALIVLLTSGMGLFALVSLNIVKRTKEIGIRRVLGAGFTNIGYLISKEFLLLLILGGFFGSLMGYFLITALLSNIWAYYVDFGLMPFILSTLLMMIIFLVTIGSQIFSVASSNPTDSLRYE